MNTHHDALASARKAFAEQEARDALEREMQRAYCRVCGGIVEARQGERLPANPWEDVALVNRERIEDAQRAKRRLPILDMWRRAHRNHAQPTPESVIAEVLGIEVTPAEGAQIAERYPVLIAARQWPLSRELAGLTPSSDEPWSWIDFKALRREVEAVVAITRPTRCWDGACGGCGVGESAGWWEAPLVWRDGEPAPFCSGCVEAWELRSSPTDLDRIRLAILRRWLPIDAMLLEPLGFKMFCEIATEDERRDGFREPFTYRPDALAAVRSRLLHRWPRFAPDDERERILAELDEQRRVAAAAEAERRAAERPAWERNGDWD